MPAPLLRRAVRRREYELLSAIQTQEIPVIVPRSAQISSKTFRPSAFKLALLVSTAVSGPCGFAATQVLAPVSDDNFAVTADTSVRATELHGVTPVNGTPTNRSAHDVAVDAQGNYVVVWERSVVDSVSGQPSSFRIKARCFDASGAPRGGEFNVGFGGTSLTLRAPSVAMTASGEFAVTWLRIDDGVTSVRRRAYDAGCQARETEKVISKESRTLNKSAPDIAMDADGDHVITWVACGDVCSVRMRRFNRKLVAFDASEIVVNQSPVPKTSEARVAMSAVGDLAVTWTGDLVPDSNFDVLARRYRRLGDARGDEFVVNLDTARAQIAPAIAMDASGDFVIAWVGYTQSFGSAGRRVFGSTFFRRVRANGRPLGPDVQAFDFEEQANGDFSRSHQPVVAMDADGDFVIAAHSFIRPENQLRGLRAQRYDFSAQRVGTSFLVNALATSSLDDPSVYPAVELDADGELLAAYSTRDPLSGLDKSTGVFLRRYTGTEDVDLQLRAKGPSDPVAAGGQLTYRLTVSNLHLPSTAIGVASIDSAIGVAGGIRFSGTLPAGFAFRGATGQGWSCTAEVLRQVDCSYSGGLAAAASTSVDLAFRANREGQLTSRFELLPAIQFDSNAGNDSTEVSTTITP